MGKQRVVGRIFEPKYSRKGHKDRNKAQEQNKREWASSVDLYLQTQTATSLSREEEPVGIVKP